MILLGLMMLSGCANSSAKNSLRSFSDSCGIDFSGGKILESDDYHGLFGDGYEFVVASYIGEDVENAIKKADHWRELPMDHDLHTFVYQPYEKHFVVPAIEHGYYYFYDRGFEVKDPYDDTGFLSRIYYNFTLAIYDSDNHILYYCRLDT